MKSFTKRKHLRGLGTALLATGAILALAVPAAHAAAPTITSFLPTSGPVGTSVTINGTGFTGATAVSFGEAGATFSVASDVEITATVPADAETGSPAPISVTTPGGTATSSADFSVDLTRRDLSINRTKTEFASGPSEGDVVYFWGTGSWDTATGLVNIGGRILHKHADGSVVAKGFWKATGFVSFTSFGSGEPPLPLLEGGVLVLQVKVFPSDGPPVVVDDFTVTCLIGTVPAGVEEGVTIPSIGATEPIDEPGRFTLFEQV